MLAGASATYWRLSRLRRKLHRTTKEPQVTSLNTAFFLIIVISPPSNVRRSLLVIRLHDDWRNYKRCRRTRLNDAISVRVILSVIEAHTHDTDPRPATTTVTTTTHVACADGLRRPCLPCDPIAGGCGMTSPESRFCAAPDRRVLRLSAAESTYRRRYHNDGTDCMPRMLPHHIMLLTLRRREPTRRHP